MTTDITVKKAPSLVSEELNDEVLEALEEAQEEQAVALLEAEDGR